MLSRRFKVTGPLLLAALGVTLQAQNAHAEEVSTGLSAEQSSTNENTVASLNQTTDVAAVQNLNQTNTDDSPSKGEPVQEEPKVSAPPEPPKEQVSAVSEEEGKQQPVSTPAQESAPLASWSETGDSQTSKQPQVNQKASETLAKSARTPDNSSVETNKATSPTRAVAGPQTASQRKTSSIEHFSTDKATYRLGDRIQVNLTFKNPTKLAQNITALAQVYSQENKIAGPYRYSKYLKPGESYSLKNGELVIPTSLLKNNHGYLLTVKVLDSQNQLLESSNKGLAVEDDWRRFPRYGVVGGSEKNHNSVLKENLPRYYRELEQMKNMNINSYFFYDVYKSSTNPFPDLPKFEQTWNWWSHSQIETEAVKAIVERVHESGAVAMLYNMILAQNANEKAVLPESEYIFNYENGGYGAKGEVMTYFIDGKPLQYYYNPSSKQWQSYISKAMEQAMKNGNFDGWQGDTIGDNRVLDYQKRGSDKFSDSYMLSDVYADFLNKIKDNLPNYYLTLNDVNGENIQKLASSKQDVIYNELWPFGTSALGGDRPQDTYGDLKARVDQVRHLTNKSLIVGAYMEEPKFDENRKPLNGAARDVLKKETYQTDAVLLTTATIAAAGGYHMSLAALANPNDGDGVGVLETAYYPTQSLRVSPELNRKNYNYQQFITAYENLLRGDGVENDPGKVQTFTETGQEVSRDELGIQGQQVWTYAKKGPHFRTIQLLNLMGISSDWKNEDGYENNKSPEEQTNLQVRYSLGDVSLSEAQRLAKQVYITSPDDWLQSAMKKVTARVETDENGKPFLLIDVPKLTLWDMIYITEAHKTEDPDQPRPPKVPEKPKPEKPQKPQKPVQPAEPKMPEKPEEPERPTKSERPIPAALDHGKPEEVSSYTKSPISQQEYSKTHLDVSVLDDSASLPQTGTKNRSRLLTLVGVSLVLVGALGLGLNSLKRRVK